MTPKISLSGLVVQALQEFSAIKNTKINIKILLHLLTRHWITSHLVSIEIFPLLIESRQYILYT